MITIRVYLLSSTSSSSPPTSSILYNFCHFHWLKIHHVTIGFFLYRRKSTSAENDIARLGRITLNKFCKDKMQWDKPSTKMNIWCEIF